MVEVTQGDREAVAAYWHISRIGNDETQRRYLSGEADEAFIVQAFAAHRTASTAAKDARIAELEAALSEAIEWDSHDSEGVPAVWLDRARKALGEG